MNDPYEELGLSSDSDDETIRRRYLELVRQFPPEQNPERFAAIRAAYERLRDLDTRLRQRLFEVGKHDTLDAILENLTCLTPRRRVSLKALLAAHRKP
jgi:curved DNA-binding protein CbpA